MHQKTHTITAVILSGFFLLLDQTCKHIALNNQAFSKYIIDPWIGWQFFANTGIAFGIPLPQPFIIIFSPIIIIGLVYWWQKKEITSLRFIYGSILIIFGAISNFIDRMLFAFTIDYIRVITSIFNVADILIITGALLLFLDSRHTSTTKKS